MPLRLQCSLEAYFTEGSVVSDSGKLKKMLSTSFHGAAGAPELGQARERHVSHECSMTTRVPAKAQKQLPHKPGCQTTEVRTARYREASRGSARSQELFS